MKKRNPLQMTPEGTNRSRPSRPRHEWSPTSKALDPFTGVCFESKDHATVCMFLHKCRCVLEADAWLPRDHKSRQGHIRLWPGAVLERKRNSSQSRNTRKSKSVSPQQPARAAARGGFRTRGTFELEPKRCTVS